MTHCPECQSAVPVGERWCPNCHAFVVRKGIGRLASPAARLGAHFLDIILPCGAIIFIAVVTGLGFSSRSMGTSGVGVLLACGLLVAYMVWAITLFSDGKTPGKQVAGIRVITEEGRSAGFLTMLIREWIGKWISALIFGLGYIWILIDRDRQGWHDKLVSTYVVEQ